MAYGTTRTWTDLTRVLNAPTGISSQTSEASISGIQITENIEVEVAANTVENATKATAYDALVTAVNTAVQTVIGTTWGIDTTGNTVDYNAKIFRVKRGTTPTDIYLPAANVDFVVSVELSVKVSEWKRTFTYTESFARKTTKKLCEKSLAKISN